MSQEKVDKYKAEKANRKKEVAKSKMKKKLYVILGVVLGIALVAWIGVSVYLEIKAQKEYESSVQAVQEAWSEYLEQLATATTSGETGTGDETTSASDKTTSADGTETSASDETTSADEETTSEEETTTSATE